LIVLPASLLPHSLNITITSPDSYVKLASWPQAIAVLNIVAVIPAVARPARATPVVVPPQRTHRRPSIQTRIRVDTEQSIHKKPSHKMLATSSFHSCLRAECRLASPACMDARFGARKHEWENKAY
jgi:hypothetical protein